MYQIQPGSLFVLDEDLILPQYLNESALIKKGQLFMIADSYDLHTGTGYYKIWFPNENICLNVKRYSLPKSRWICNST